MARSMSSRLFVAVIIVVVLVILFGYMYWNSFEPLEPEITFIPSDCPKHEPCERQRKEVAPISTRDFSAEIKTEPFADTHRPEFDDYEYTETIDVCVFLACYKVRTEKETSFTMYFEKKRYNYHIVYIYSSNDKDMPKDGREGFIVFPEHSDFSSLLKKVWFGMEYYYDKKCDFVVKSDDDLMINWLHSTYIVRNLNPNSWAGRHKNAGHPVQMNPKSKWYDINYKHYMNSNSYTEFLFGPLYYLGKDQYMCMANEGKRRVREEKEKEYKFIDLHNEDVSMGILGSLCPNRQVKNLVGRFKGDELYALYDHQGWMWDFFVLHSKSPERETELPLWETI